MHTLFTKPCSSYEDSVVVLRKILSVPLIEECSRTASIDSNFKEDELVVSTKVFNIIFNRHVRSSKIVHDICEIFEQIYRLVSSGVITYTPELFGLMTDCIERIKEIKKISNDYNKFFDNISQQISIVKDISYSAHRPLEDFVSWSN